MSENQYQIEMESFIKASFGTFTITSTAEVEKNAHAIKVESDTVFARLEIDGVTGTDERDMYLDAVGGTVPAGTLITCNEDHVFSAVTLTSGCVTLLLASSSEA